MAGLTEFYCGWNEPSHASQFKWLEYTFKPNLYDILQEEGHNRKCFIVINSFICIELISGEKKNGKKNRNFKNEKNCKIYILCKNINKNV
jgi:hypothetical protein